MRPKNLTKIHLVDIINKLLGHLDWVNHPISRHRYEIDQAINKLVKYFDFTEGHASLLSKLNKITPHLNRFVLRNPLRFVNAIKKYDLYCIAKILEGIIQERQRITYGNSI